MAAASRLIRRHSISDAASDSPSGPAPAPNTTSAPAPGADVIEARFAAFRNRQIAVLERVAAGAALTVTFEAVIEMIQEQSPGTLASILTLDPDGLHLRHGAAPDLPAAYCRAIDGAPIGPQVGSCGTAAYLKQRVIVSDIARDPLWAEYRDLALGHGLRSCWSEPILDSHGGVVGSFAMYHREVSLPSDEDLQIIGILGVKATDQERIEPPRGHGVHHTAVHSVSPEPNLSRDSPGRPAK